MIVTLTANPSIDRTVDVPRLRRGAVIRAAASHVDAGGKGVNVARALTAHGYPAAAVLPCGGAEGAQLATLLRQVPGLRLVAVPIAGAIRANVTVVELDGTTTKLNEPGPVLTPAELSALADALVDAAEQARWVVLSGSLPPGAPDDWYAGLIAALAERDRRVAVDTSGAALAAAVRAGPQLVKPNRDELAELAGRSLDSLADVVDAARALQERGARDVLTSLGPDGAVLVTRAAAWHASAPPVRLKSTVGAGDAALAGFLAAGSPPVQALTTAVAWGSAAAALAGTRMPTPAELPHADVVVTPLSAAAAAALTLTEP